MSHFFKSLLSFSYNEWMGKTVTLTILGEWLFNERIWHCFWFVANIEFRHQTFYRFSRNLKFMSNRHRMCRRTLLLPHWTSLCLSVNMLYNIIIWICWKRNLVNISSVSGKIVAWECFQAKKNNVLGITKQIIISFGPFIPMPSLVCVCVNFFLLLLYFAFCNGWKYFLNTPSCRSSYLIKLFFSSWI